nr:hypothetical protein [Tanacetum cinerariifolium]
MHEKFQMSAMGKLNFFLGLQALQKEDGIFLSQDKLSMPCEALSKEISSSMLRLIKLLEDKDRGAAEQSGDDASIKGRSQGEACPTDSGFKADQDRANIAKTSTLPSDSTPRVTSLTANEGSMQQKLDELTALYTNMQRQQSEMVSRGAAEQSGDDASIKGRRLDKGEEAAERISDDTEEMATVLTSMDAASILTNGVVQVVSTAAEVATVTGEGLGTPIEQYTKRTRIAQSSVLPPVADEPASPHGDDSQGEACPTDSGFKADQDRANIAKTSTLPSDSTPRVTSLTANEGIWKQIEDFVHMGSKEEGERFKRKGLRLEQDSAKKVKTSKEVSEEDLKTMIQLVPVEGVYVEALQLVPVEEIYIEALQVKHLIIDWEVHTEGQRSYWKIIRLGDSSASYQFFVDMLKYFDIEDLNQLWGLVKETLNIKPATKWRLYDTCGVHHLSTKDQDIFMLIEKDYPLRKGLAIVMISYKLQVENYSQMGNDLIMKIYKIANSPKQQGIPTGSDKFPLPEQLPTSNEDKFLLLIQSDATATEVKE